LRSTFRGFQRVIEEAAAIVDARRGAARLQQIRARAIRAREIATPAETFVKKRVAADVEAIAVVDHGFREAADPACRPSNNDGRYAPAPA